MRKCSRTHDYLFLGGSSSYASWRTIGWKPPWTFRPTPLSSGTAVDIPRVAGSQVSDICKFRGKRNKVPGFSLTALGYHRVQAMKKGEFRQFVPAAASRQISRQGALRPGGCHQNRLVAGRKHDPQSPGQRLGSRVRTHKGQGERIKKQNPNRWKDA